MRTRLLPENEARHAHGQQHILRAYRPCVRTVYNIILVCVCAYTMAARNLVFNGEKNENNVLESYYIVANGCHRQCQTSVVRYLKLERRYQLRRRYRDTRYYRDTGVPYKKCRQISISLALTNTHYPVMHAVLLFLLLDCEVY